MLRLANSNLIELRRFSLVKFPACLRSKHFQRLLLKNVPKKVGFSIGFFVVVRGLIRPVRCDIGSAVGLTVENRHLFEIFETKKADRSWLGKIYFCFLVGFRCFLLLLVYLPLFIAFPLVRWSNAARSQWWRCFLFCIQRSGPVFVKFGQWASTRRDLFSAEFCNLFSQLHAKTIAHRWSYSRKLLTLTFGEEWRLFLGEIPREPCGSGCIAQVYKATLNLSNLKLCKARYLFDVAEKEETETKLNVAIKILHPNIEQDVEIDITLLKGFARLANVLSSRIHCLDLLSCVGEFEKVIKKQTDLRFEGATLKRFRQNFHNHSSVVFPQPLFQSPCILIETFEEGRQISDYLNTEDIDLKSRLAQLGADGLLKMVFVDNFVHGDLHPGNILVQQFENKPRPHLLAKWFPGFFAQPIAKQQHRLVFLDTGLTVELRKKDLENMRSLFKAVVLKDGKRVADLLLSQSPQQRCQNIEQFREEITNLVTTALEQTVSLGQIHVSSLLSDLLDVVSRHQVNLEPNFTCIVLSVLVLEGLGRSLDPNLDLIKCARKFLFS